MTEISLIVTLKNQFTLTLLTDLPERPSCFSDRQKNLVEDVDILLSVKIRWIAFIDFREVENVSANLVFLIDPKNTNVVEDVDTLLPVKFRWIPFINFRGEVEKVSSNQRPGRPSCFFLIGMKNTNLVEKIEILLPVKYRWFPLSGYRGGVENVSANQSPRRPSCFSDRPEIQFEFEFNGVLRHMQRYFSHICDGIDVQADCRRSSTYGRAPNAIDIS